MSEKQFKVGQKVMCVEEGSGLFVKFGDIYTISDIIHTESTINVKVQEVTGQALCSSRFLPVQEEFNMKTEPWFIEVESEVEFRAVQKYLESLGFWFDESAFDSARFLNLITNLYNTCSKTVIPNSELRAMKTSSEFLQILRDRGHFKEIKVNYEVSSLILPEILTEEQKEIQKIQEEIRVLEDRLNKLQGV